MITQIFDSCEAAASSSSTWSTILSLARAVDTLEMVKQDPRRGEGSVVLGIVPLHVLCYGDGGRRGSWCQSRVLPQETVELTDYLGRDVVWLCGCCCFLLFVCCWLSDALGDGCLHSEVIDWSTLFASDELGLHIFTFTEQRNCKNVLAPVQHSASPPWLFWCAWQPDVLRPNIARTSSHNQRVHIRLTKHNKKWKEID